MTEEQENTYEYICFGDIAYEFDFSDKRETEHKIKQRLKYYQLGDYDQKRVDYVRELKKELYTEIDKQTESKYFHKYKSSFADLKDFDFDKMLADYTTKYDRISKSDMAQILNFAIYLYYLR